MLPAILTNVTAVLNALVGIGIATFAFYLFWKLRWWVDLGIAVSGLALALIYSWVVLFSPPTSVLAAAGVDLVRQSLLALQVFVLALEVERIKECR